MVESPGDGGQRKDHPMHLRKLTILTGFLGAFFASWTFGLGLGEIKLNSSLNQPLDADIKLLQVRDLLVEDIYIDLASAEDFKRIGVERPFFLQSLKFDVRLDGSGGPVVKITSEQTVREPFVNFLIEARWPSGRLLREYTVLPDLPVFSNRPVQPVRAPIVQAPPVVTPAPVVSQPAPAPRPEPVRPQAVEPASEQSAPTPKPSEPEPPAVTKPAQVQTTPERTPSTRSSGPQSYSVNADDTLWEIALEVRPNREVSVQKTMLALQRLNPDAFINGNINLLKQGQVLRVPNQNEIEVLDQFAAIDEVKFQNNEWRGGEDLSSAAELEGSSSRASLPAVEQKPRGQLSLAAPSSQDNASGRSSSGDSSANTDALENELTISLEELDSVRRENTELSGRIADLEEQVDTLDRLIEVSNEEMRVLELAIEMGDSSAEELADTALGEASDILDSQSELSAEVDTNLSGEASAVVGTFTDTDSTPEEALTEEVIAEEPELQVSEVVPARVSKKPSLVDTLKGYIWYIVAGLAALLIALIAFVMHRRTQAQMAEFDEFDEDEFYDETDDIPEQSTYEELEDDSNLDDTFDIGEDENENLEEEPVPTEAETGDAVGEADIYIAYGKYDQAEELLQKAIISEPDNIAARAKLLEVYSETKDIEKFDQEYSQLLSFDDDSVNKRAAELRTLIPGAAAFAGIATAATSLSSGAASDENFGLDDVEAADATASPSTEAAEDELGDLSFDLEDDSASSDAGDSSLDLDLEVDGDGDESLLGDAPEQVNANFASLDDELSGDDGAMDFSLDLDSDDSEQKDDDLELSLDLDLDDDDESGLNLDLDDDDLNISLGELDAATQSKSDSDDILSDLEFSAAAITPEAEASSAEKSAQPSESSSSELGDDFDMDMDNDVDLAALDAEMDDLVGGLDDLDDQDSSAPLVSDTSAEVPTDAKDELASLDLDSISKSLNEELNEPVAEPVTPIAEAVDLETNAVSTDNAEVDLELDAGLGEDLNNELDFLADTDEVATKLDLARAYIDMGDGEGAKDILDEVNSEGNDEQKQEAADLLGKIK